MANNLSQDQVNVIKDFRRYLEDDSNYMVVSGAAGTGKTTLIQELQTAAYDNSWKCIPLGVWGRSSSAIVQITGIPAVTVSKYNRVYDDISRDKISEKSFSEWYQNFYQKKFSFFSSYVAPILKIFLQKRNEFMNTVLIIDEASTLEIHELLLAFKNTLSNSSKVKILLLGDECQLPPRNANANKLFDYNWIDDNTQFKTFEKIKKLEISHRVSEGPLFNLANSIRNIVSEKGTGKDARTTIRDSFNSKEVLGLGKQICYEKLKSSNNIKENIFIASEDEAAEVRNDLRNIYLNNPQEPLVKNDFIRSRINGIKDDFVTGDEFYVKEVRDKIGNFVIVNVEVVSRIKEYTGNLLRDIWKFSSGLFTNNQNREAKIAIYLPPLIDDAEFAKGTNFVRADIFRAWYSLNEEPNVDDVVAVSYGYAVTIKHAQGGEWNTVALSLDSELETDSARYWYTAITRAKKELLII
jgi:hypothetical protein